MNSKSFEKKVEMLLTAKRHLVVGKQPEIKELMHAAYNLQLDYTTVLTTLKSTKNFEWFKFYLQGFFDVTLLLLDQVLVLQNGRLIQQHQQEESKTLPYTHPTRKDYFNSDYAQGSGETKLTILSIDGYHYTQRELRVALKVSAYYYVSTTEHSQRALF